MLDEGIAIEKYVRKPDQVKEFKTSQEQAWQAWLKEAGQLPCDTLTLNIEIWEET